MDEGNRTEGRGGGRGRGGGGKNIWRKVETGKRKSKYVTNEIGLCKYKSNITLYTGQIR